MIRNMFLLSLLTLCSFLFLAPPVQAGEKLRIVTTLPDLKWVADKIAGNAAEVEALVDGDEDPHNVSPTPALMAQITDADLFIEVGMELELWTDNLLDGAGNDKIMPGKPGHVYASDNIQPLEVPSVASRSEGNIHPQGNPHITTDPLTMVNAAENILAGLKRIAPGNKVFDNNFADFKKEIAQHMYGKKLVKMLGANTMIRLDRGGKLDAFLKKHKYKKKSLATYLGGWKARAAKLKDTPVIFYAHLWPYFIERYSINCIGYVEEKPGISPQAAHLDKLIKKIKSNSGTVILQANYYDPKYPNHLKEKTGARFVQVPALVGGTKKVKDYFALIDVLLDAVEGKKKEAEKDRK